ncbi:MAG: SsrA-binding protein [Gammaproteobacteria bacterium RIFCSPHIGHO2_12_FULL_41_15]|nr:MAG: SsrA-binding protein [Gammaproteobacteria bacterium RIFCSPHIGHO2_12_FULL_41_15]
MGKKTLGRIIADNRKAHHDYYLEETFEAGLVLEGWELKSLRAGKVQLKESYVKLLQGEAWLIGCHISALQSVCTHTIADPIRTRKLLMHRKEINKLQKAIDRQGYTIIPVNLHWKAARVKLDIAIAKGKQLHDKRQTLKDRDWQRNKDRILKGG